MVFKIGDRVGLKDDSRGIRNDYEIVAFLSPQHAYLYDHLKSKHITVSLHKLERYVQH